MSASEIGRRLVELCRQGKNMECIEALYADNIVSVEAADFPGFARVTEGKKAVLEKNVLWGEMNDVKSSVVEGPFPNGADRFAVIFRYDVVNKKSGQRNKMDEVALFTVVRDRIVREEFFYPT